MKILVIDNFDSFTFNLVQLLGKYRSKLLVVMNDDKINSIRAFQPDKILISPGPGRPENSALTLEAIKEFGNSIPILGVCLGMQAICYLFGAEIVKAENIYHGKTSAIIHDNKTIFNNLPQHFDAMRYHSLIVKENTISDEIEVSAKAVSGEVMGIRHKIYSLEGIQFHPESILTPTGKKLIKNWLNLD
ncbi:MAG: aminodeoxychorismate/anthranilate synthase component II [Ignavibacteriota bacterium]|nr:MAG: aminodeoxychorismate/anthranilate synthase component II [Chlorobiota bacterium]MBE7476590.1 aminodeoxychorismate/anthranilate synthase component II [Ignavibacteriales bacterium]MBL1123730.1 aminodeoxychorismate/anthranilate synthase component II [Ignavibacteriota bacterium]MCC7093789.1 aminodeoxychorismate/anthranilate synthase component II [Ignavibacteriaceae bacterium]MCE7855617.1 aminodeoxychorismate/anthranilate synthase component II [Ignavibacteria bacterium CHB3]MEB2294979.1 amin